MRAFAFALMIGMSLPVLVWAQAGGAVPDSKTPPAPAAKPSDPNAPANPPPKLPRFESLRPKDVRLRIGPGPQFKIDWIYKRADLPVEIEREFGHWRAIRDPDGVRGWVSQAALMTRRTFIVQGADATLRDDPDDKAAPVAVLKPGVIGRIRSCAKDSDWCQMQVADLRGYLRREQFWGTLPNEEIPTP